MPDVRRKAFGVERLNGAQAAMLNGITCMMALGDDEKTALIHQRVA